MQVLTSALCRCKNYTERCAYTASPIRKPSTACPTNTQHSYKHASQGQSPAQHIAHIADTTQQRTHTPRPPPPAPRPEKGRRLLPLGLRPSLCGLSPRCGLLMRGLRTGRASLQRCNTAVQRAQYTRPPGALGASLRSASLRSASPSTTELGAAVVCTATAPHRGCWSRLLLPSPYIWCAPHNSRETV